MKRNSDNSFECDLFGKPNGPSALTSVSSDGELTGTRAIDRLNDIDWNFAEADRQDGLAALHPYPAKFINDIPRNLIKALRPEDGSWIFDPFCGSGTTLIEAQRAGVPAFGTDLNPIACLMSRVKTSPLADHIDASIDRVVNEAAIETDVMLPTMPNIDHWFERSVQQALARLSNAIQEADSASQDFLRVVLSSIIVRVSRQDSDTRYAAVENGYRGPDVVKAYYLAAKKARAALSSRAPIASSVVVTEADILKLDPSSFPGTVGLVVTSPPYPNAYEYWLYHKYRMFWLGFDPLIVKELEIGARPHFFKKNPHTAEHFQHQMRKVLELVERVLTRKGHVAVVVGRSKIHGRIVDNAALIEAAGKEVGFRVCYRTERVIAPTRKSFNLSHAKIKSETILVLERT